MFTGLDNLETLDLFANSSLVMEETLCELKSLKNLKKLNLWQTETNYFTLKSDYFHSLVEITTNQSNVYSQFFNTFHSSEDSFLFYILDHEEDREKNEISFRGYLYANKLFSKEKEKEWTYKERISLKYNESEMVLLRFNLSSEKLGKYLTRIFS